MESSTIWFSATFSKFSSMYLIPIPVIDYDSEAAKEYGDIRSSLEKAGTPIGPLDMMIASHARSKGYVLVTNNTREFDRVSNLRVENWAE